MRPFTAMICLIFALTDCSGPRPPLNPPRLVMSSQTDMAIQLFMQATILLSNFYGYKTIQYSEIQARSASAGFSALPFMPPETVRATPELVNFSNAYEDDQAMLDSIIKKYGYKSLVKYYVRTGLRASQLVCRNYLLGLEEGNQYLEFLRKEFGVGYTLATGVLQLTSANETLLSSFLVSRSFVDGAITTYEEYRFLNVDREAARVVVETAQNKYAEYFSEQVDKASTDPNDAAGGYTFSDALHAVSTIEYQCTREGIRALLNNSISNTPTNLEIDKPTGTVMFKSTRAFVQPATGTSALPTGIPPAKLPVPGTAADVPGHPVVVVPAGPGLPKGPVTANVSPAPGPKPVTPTATDVAAAKLTAFYNMDQKAAEKALAIMFTDAEVLKLFNDPNVQKLKSATGGFKVKDVISMPGYEAIRMKLCDKLPMACT